MKGLCESCTWDGEKCNVRNERDELGAISKCIGYDHRDCTVRKYGEKEE